MYPILLVTCVIIIIVLVIAVHEKSTNAICMSRRRLEGRTVLVTGGTAGMGLVIATDLAHRGARVIIACPFPEEGLNAEKQIVEETGNQKVVFKLLDLASTKSIRTFAAEILKIEKRLDILVNNAGVGAPIDFFTKDGMTFIMQVNYYGTFLLTLLLLPLLKKTGTPNEPSRIVCTASVMHLIGSTNINSLNKVGKLSNWSSILAYSNSKICLILFAKELTERLKGSNVVINNVDPGAVGTRIFDALNKVLGFFVTLSFCIVFKTPWQGAQTALHVALDDKAGEVSGKFFKNCSVGRCVQRADCKKTAQQLWDHSVALVNLSDEELVKCFQSL